MYNYIESDLVVLVIVKFSVKVIKITIHYEDMNWKMISMALLVLVIILAIVAGILATRTPSPSGVSTTTVTVTSTTTILQGTPSSAPSATTVTTTVTSAAPATIKIFFFNPEPANYWWNLVVEGVQTAVQQLRTAGYNVVFQEFDATTVNQQISQLQQASSLKPDIIVVGTVSDAVQDALKSLRNQGVVVILVDRDVPDRSARDLYLGTNNMAAAMFEANALINYLRSQRVPTPWKFVIVGGLPGVPTVQLRAQGYEQALAPLVQNGTAQILQVLQTNTGDLAQVYSAVSPVVTKYGTSVTAYLGVNDYTAIGTVQALEAAGYKIGPGGIYVLGFDAQLPSWLALIRNGTVFMTLQQVPFVEGYWGVWAGFYIKIGQLKLPPNATIYTPVYVVVPCNATYSMVLDHIAPPPQYLLLLAQSLTPQSPAIQAPSYYAYNCMENMGTVPPPPALGIPWPVVAGSDRSFVVTGFK